MGAFGHNFNHRQSTPSFPSRNPVITASMTTFRLAPFIDEMIIRIIGPAFRAP
jgi:hypothetical protein